MESLQCHMHLKSYLVGLKCVFIGVPKEGQHCGYDKRRSGGLWINCDHPGSFNAHLNLGTYESACFFSSFSFFFHFAAIGMRPPRPETFIVLMRALSVRDGKPLEKDAIKLVQST